MQTKQKNPFRISVDKALANAGHDLESFIESGAALDSIVPACCSDGCEVEPDGCCEHGCPAVTIALGVI